MKNVITNLLFLIFANSLFAAEIILQNPEVNKEAPLFSVIDSNGMQINLADFRGQPVILEWTNHECPYVAKHYSEKNMQALQKMAQNKDIVWLSIISSTPGEQGHVDANTANKLSKTRDAYPTHVLLDESGEVGMKYGAKTTPHMFMIDSNGVLRYKGAIDDVGRGMQFFSASLQDAFNYVATQLDALQEAGQLQIGSTNPYGCSVKYNYD